MTTVFMFNAVVQYSGEVCHLLWYFAMEECHGWDKGVQELSVCLPFHVHEGERYVHGFGHDYNQLICED